MKLYHLTNRKNIPSILKEGLHPNRLGIVYLTPTPSRVAGGEEICLEVNTGDLKLTAFEDCSSWEILCWGHIAGANIKILEGKK